MNLEDLDEQLLIRYLTFVLKRDIKIKIENGNLMYQNGNFKWTIFSTSPEVALKIAYSWNAKQKRRRVTDV